MIIRLTLLFSAFALIACSNGGSSGGAGGSPGNYDKAKASTLSCSGFSSAAQKGAPQPIGTTPKMTGGNIEVFSDKENAHNGSSKTYVVSATEDQCLRVSGIQMDPIMINGFYPGLSIVITDPVSGEYETLREDQSFFIGANEKKLLKFTVGTCNGCPVTSAALWFVNEKEEKISFPSSPFSISKSGDPKQVSISFNFTIPESLYWEFNGAIENDRRSDSADHFAFSIPELTQNGRNCKIAGRGMQMTTRNVISASIYIACDIYTDPSFINNIREIIYLTGQGRDPFSGNVVSRYRIKP